MALQVTLSALVFFSAFSPGLSTPGETFNYVFEKGRPKFRNDFLNLNVDQLKFFCDHTNFYLENYDNRWDIHDQLVLDQSLCDYAKDKIPKSKVVMVQEPIPTILIEGILPFGLQATNRTDLLNSLKWRDFIHHCYLTEIYLTHYMLEYGSWEQLLLDFSTCLHNKNYHRLLDQSNLTTLDNTLQSFIKQLQPNDNLLHVPLYHGPVYLYGSYISRKEVEKYDDIELNQFCNRVVHLYENYFPNWGIEELLEIDVLACYLQVKSRKNFKRMTTPASNEPPNIVVKGEVLYNKEKSIWRLGQLLSMAPAQLRLHCNKTAILLKEYKDVWQTFDEMAWDANFCNVELHRQNLVNNITSSSLSVLPQKIAEGSIENNVQTCKDLGDIIHKNWRLGHGKNELLVSLRTCMWQITPYVLCINDTYQNSRQQTDFLLLNSYTPPKNWDAFKLLNAEEVIALCLQTIARIHYLYTDKEENVKLLSQMQMCMHVFKKKSYQSKSNEFYIANDKLISMEQETPVCSDSLATALQVIFPKSKLSEVYSHRNMHNNNTVLYTFTHDWETKKNQVYFTKYCNNVTTEKPRLFTKSKFCSDLKLMEQNVSISDYCSNSVKSLKKEKGNMRKLLEKLNILQICLRIVICPAFNCTSVKLSRWPAKGENDLKCSKLVTDLLQKNYKSLKYNLLQLQTLRKEILNCQKDSLDTVTDSTENSKSMMTSTEITYNLQKPVTDEDIDYIVDQVEYSTKYSNISLVKTPDVFELLHDPQSTEDTSNSQESNERDENPAPLILVGAAGALAGIAGGAVLGIGGLIGGLLSPKFHIPEFNRPMDLESIEVDDSYENSQEETTTIKSSTTTTPTTTITITTTEKVYTTTEQWTTTEEPSTTTVEPDVCWLEPLATRTVNDKRRYSRSPDNRLLPASKYPEFPMGNCRLNINELNSCHDDKTSYEFIELIRMCKEGGRREKVPQKYLENYMLLLVNGEKEEIVFSATLSGAVSKKGGDDYFITVGPPGREEVSLAFNDDNVHYSSKDNGDILPNGLKVANMLILLYIPKKSVRRYLLPSPGKGVKLNEMEKQVLKTHRQDCLVYGASAFKDKCGIFEQICPELLHRKMEYMLRDWQQNKNDEFEDLSLSRCIDHIYPMDVWGFKLANPTPSKPNECHGAVRFVLSQNLEVLPLRDEDGIDSLENNDEFPHCDATIPERRVKDLDYSEFRSGIKRNRDAVVRSCMEGDLSNSRLSGYLTSMRKFDEQLKNRKDKTGYWFERGCRPHIRAYLETHLPKKVELKVCDDIQIGWWLDLAEENSEEDPSSRKLNCFICKEFYKSNLAFAPDIRRKTKLMTDEGYLDESSRAKKINTETLYAHAKSMVHLDAADYVRHKLFDTKYEKMRTAMRSQVPPRERLTRPTENLFYQVMFSVVHGYPSGHFKDEINFNRKFYYSEYGTKHQTLPGYKRIVGSVAMDYYLELLNNIKHQNPFSIVLDTYRDFSGRSMLAVSLMMIYKSKVQMKYFCLVELTSDHTAMAQYVSILDHIIEAPVNIHQEFFRGLVYFVGDGASTNNGRHNSILTRFREATGREIQFYHCSSHRLHLVFTKILKNSNFLHVGVVVKSVDEISGFFDTRSNRLARLHEEQQKDGRRPLSPHKPHPVRWASSMRLGFNKIYAIYPWVVRILKKTIADRSNPEKARVKAERIYDLIATKDYIVWLAFLSDLLDLFAGFSQYTQEKSGTLIDQVDMQKQLRTELQKLAKADGETMKKLLDDVKCDPTKSRGTCDLAKFEMYGTHFKDIRLDGIGTNLEKTKLSKLRQEYINMVISELDLQFNRKYEMYTIFNPKNFQIPEDVQTQFSEDSSRDPPESFDYGKDEFPKIVKDIAKPYSQGLYDEWRKLIWNIVTNANFPQIRLMKPTDFWMATLERNHLPWTGRLIWIIKACLVIPTSSAEIERIFSSVTYLLGRYRISTSISTLNDYLRLRSELPIPLTDWQAYPHVLTFLERRHMLSNEAENAEEEIEQASEEFETSLDDDDVIICDEDDECVFDYSSFTEGNH